MQKTITSIAVAIATVLGSSFAIQQTANAATPQSVAEGKKLSWDRKKGNCLACHMMPGGESPGDIGPPLVAMQVRFPDRQKLFDQIYDATTINASSRMPPFGKHDVLSQQEIDKVIDYLYTL